MNFEVQRNSHAFNLDSVYKDYGTNFQTQVGFIPTSNIRSNQTWANYKWFPSHRLFQTVGVETSQSIAFDHQGNRVSHYSSFDPFVQLPRRVMFAPIVGQSSDTLGPQDGTLLTENENFTQNYGGLFTRGAPLTQLSFNVVAVRGGNVNYNPPAGGVPSLLNQQSAEAYLTLQPLHQLTADNTYLLDRDFAADDNGFVYESQTLRTRVNYQFTRAFSARVIVEYDSTLANPLETSLQHTKQVGTEALLTWLPHPGTAIYVGYNDDLQNLDRTLCNRLAQRRLRSGQHRPAALPAVPQRQPPDLRQGLVPVPLLIGALPRVSCVVYTAGKCESAVPLASLLRSAFNSALAACIVTFLLALAPGLAQGNKAAQLRIYSIDVEGGQSTLLVAPSGASLLVDTGWPGSNGRDADRVQAAMRDAGITKIDHLLVTHYHTDHVGGVPELVKRVPIGEFLDHGENREDSDITRHDYAAYLKAIEGKPHRVVHPGDTIDLPGLSAIVLTADGEHISSSRASSRSPILTAPPNPRPKRTPARTPVPSVSSSPTASFVSWISAT